MPGGGDDSLGGSLLQAADAAEPEEDPPFVGIRTQTEGCGWRADLTIGGKNKYLGAFCSRAEAAAARDLAALWKQLHKILRELGTPSKCTAYTERSEVDSLP